MRLILALSIVLAACGGDEPSGPTGACPEIADTDAGDLPALYAQRCNVPMSMGSKNWYRLSATMPDRPLIVQVELWPFLGAFKGGVVHAGTFTIAGDELEFGTCGVCVRAMTDKGLDSQREYFATGGTVEVTAVGPDAGVPFVATVLDASFAEINSDRTVVADGCAVDLARVKVSGSVMPMGGSGGGGGGGGNSGNAGCKTTVGD